MHDDDFEEKDCSMEECKDHENPIEQHDEEISKMLRRIQVLVNQDASNSDILDELLVQGAVTMQKMHREIVRLTNDKEQRRWQELIEMRFATFQSLQKRMQYTGEYLAVGRDEPLQ